MMPEIRSATACECATPSVRSRPEPPPQKRFGSGASTATPASPAWTAWFGKSKKDCPPSPCRSTFRPRVPVALAVWAPPVTPESAVNWSAGAETLKRRGRPLGIVRYYDLICT